MNKPFYLQVDFSDYLEIREFCSENNINVRASSELFSFVAEEAVNIIEKEDKLNLKNLFSKAEDSEYEYDTICDHVEEAIVSVLDANFDIIKDTFYNRLEDREIYKKEK